MGFMIEDGIGNGYRAGVNRKNRTMVRASTNLSGHFVSREDALLFNTVSHDADAAAGDVVFYFKNTSSTHLFFVDLMRVGAVLTALWKVWFVTGTASGGGTVTPVNLNRTSGKTAEATALGTSAIGSLTLASQIAHIRHPANSSAEISFDDTVILGNGNAIGVEVDTIASNTIVEVLMRDYYELPTD